MSPPSVPPTIPPIAPLEMPFEVGCVTGEEFSGAGAIEMLEVIVEVWLTIEDDEIVGETTTELVAEKPRGRMTCATTGCSCR